MDTEFFIGGLDTKFFWSCQICEQKFFLEFFPLLSALDSEFLGGGGLGTNFFWSC